MLLLMLGVEDTQVANEDTSQMFDTIASHGKTFSVFTADKASAQWELGDPKSS